jgi:hypothetical protein
VWLVNNDRNIGNIIGRSTVSGDIDLVAIDFEKSVAIRSSTPIVSVPMIPSRSLWPTEALGRLCRHVVEYRKEPVERIKTISDPALEGMVSRSVEAVGVGADTPHYRTS